MHTLVINSAHFRLPDNFNGNMSDALRLLADYHEEVAGNRHSTTVKVSDDMMNMSFKSVEGDLWDNFIEQVQLGKRFIGLLSLSSYDPLVQLPSI